MTVLPTNTTKHIPAVLIILWKCKEGFVCHFGNQSISFTPKPNKVALMLASVFCSYCNIIFVSSAKPNI